MRRILIVGLGFGLTIMGCDTAETQIANAVCPEPESVYALLSSQLEEDNTSIQKIQDCINRPGTSTAMFAFCLNPANDDME